MTIQKIMHYIPPNPIGTNSVEEFRLKLNVIEDSSNYLIHRDVLRHQLSRKQGTVSTKTRSEVRGGGKKPWRQKGTGRARAGSNRSPLCHSMLRVLIKFFLLLINLMYSNWLRKLIQHFLNFELRVLGILFFLKRQLIVFFYLRLYLHIVDKIYKKLLFWA